MAETEPLTRTEDEVDVYLKMKQHPKAKLLDEIFSDGTDASILSDEQIKDAKEEYFKRLEEMFQGTTDDQGEVIEPTEAQAAAEKVIDLDRERLSALDEALATDPAARYLVLLADEVSRFRNHRLAEGDNEPALQNRLDDAEQKFQDVYDDYENNKGSEDVLGYVLEKAFAPTIPERANSDQEPQPNPTELEPTEEDGKNYNNAHRGDAAAFSAFFDKFAGPIGFIPSETQQATINRARLGDKAAIIESLDLLEAADDARVGTNPAENPGAPTNESDIHIDGSPAGVAAAEATAEAARKNERNKRKAMSIRELSERAYAGDAVTFDELMDMYPDFKPDVEQNITILRARGGDQDAIGEALAFAREAQTEHNEKTRIENDPTFILSRKSNENLGELAIYDLDAFNIYLARFNQDGFTDEQRALFAEVQAGNTDKLGEAVGEIWIRDDEIKTQLEADSKAEELKNAEKIEQNVWRKIGASAKDIFRPEFWGARYLAAKDLYHDKRDGFLSRGITDDMDEYQRQEVYDDNRRNFMFGAGIVTAGVAVLLIINNMNHAFSGADASANIGGSKGATGGATGSETLNDNSGGSMGGQPGAEAGGLTGTETQPTIEFQPDAAMNIPVGGGGIAMFNRLGIPINNWYGNEFELLSKFPNSFYPLDGHVGITNPGPLPREVQEYINTLR